jgi:MFS superfamily sulfate permease-like transporter
MFTVGIATGILLALAFFFIKFLSNVISFFSLIPIVKRLIKSRNIQIKNNWVFYHYDQYHSFKNYNAHHKI